MNDKEYKQFLINLVNEIDFNPKKEEKSNDFDNKKKKKETKIGSTNIRSVATICENADCFEEVKLYIEYKIAKGNGWDQKINLSKNGKDSTKIFGDAVIEHMEQIYSLCKEKNNNVDESILEKISLNKIGLYFGYLFWKKAYVEKNKAEEA